MMTDRNYITTLKTEKTHIIADLYRLTEVYAIKGRLPEAICAILSEKEAAYLPHAHVLCKHSDGVCDDILYKFHNVAEFGESMNEEIIARCDTFTLSRLNRRLDLKRDPKRGQWVLSGEVEMLWYDLPFGEYKYYQYSGKVVREYKSSYQIVDPETGDWKAGGEYYFDCKYEFDCVTLSQDEAKALIEKEQEEALGKLFRTMALSFERYGKSIDELMPDIRDRVIGTDCEKVLQYDTCQEDAYYVSSLDGMIFNAVPPRYVETPLLRSYNIGMDGIPFWDRATGMLEEDLADGRTELWRIPDQIIEELDLQNVRTGDSHSKRFPALWFGRLTGRADTAEKEWLVEQANRAIQEYGAWLKASGTAGEEIGRFERKTFQEKLEEAGNAVERKLHYNYESGRHYAMINFGEKIGTPGPDCIIISILKDACWDNIYHWSDFFLICEDKSKIHADMVLDIGERLRDGITELQRIYPHIYILVRMLAYTGESKETFQYDRYYTDLENKAKWMDLYNDAWVFQGRWMVV